MEARGMGYTAKLSDDGKKLTIEVDLTHKGPPSKSGKTMLVASTQGNVAFGDAKVGLNVYRPIAG